MAEPVQEGIDYYWEGSYMVFTAAYHLKRGYCCGSSCRHCPWREEQMRAEQEHEDQASKAGDHPREYD